MHHCINMCSGFGGRGRGRLSSGCGWRWDEREWFFHSSVQKRLVAHCCWPPAQLCVLHSRSYEAVFMRLWLRALWETRQSVGQRRTTCTNKWMGQIITLNMAAVWHRRTFSEMTSDHSGNISSTVLTQGSIITAELLLFHLRKTHRIHI